MNRLTISKTFTFEASHVLPKHPGKCSRLHGHSWVLTIGVSGLVNPETGFVVDYAELKKCVDEHVIEKLDHTHLGFSRAYHSLGTWSDYEVADLIATEPTCAVPYFGEEFYPSSENLVVAIARLLDPLIQELPGYKVVDGPRQGLRLEFVRLNETCTSQAEWRYNG